MCIQDCDKEKDTFDNSYGSFFGKRLEHLKVSE